MKLNFRVNDTMHEISLEPRLTLLERDLLRVVLDRGLVYRWIDADVRWSHPAPSGQEPLFGQPIGMPDS